MDESRPVPDALSASRAAALQRLGRSDEARSVLNELLAHARRAIEAGPGPLPPPAAQAENRYLEGLALKGLGKREEARASFDSALSLRPGHRRSRWETSGFAGE